jgi:hypothetical protein
VFLAFKGAGNDNLNLMLSRNGGASFEAKASFGDASDRAPTLASHSGRLWLAWKGSGNEGLNLGRVSLFGNTAGGVGIEGLEGRDAVKMRFQNGEVAWVPAQGSRMVVAGYQQDDNLILNWGDTAPFSYDKFIVRWDRDGRNYRSGRCFRLYRPHEWFFPRCTGAVAGTLQPYSRGLPYRHRRLEVPGGLDHFVGG